jgi:amidase
MLRVLPKDSVILSFNRENPHVYEVDDGEVFWVEVYDCYKGQITDELVHDRSSIDPSVIDCSVGPIAVRGASPGDTLCVEVKDIELADWGVMVTLPGMGVLGDKILSSKTRIIDVKDGFARFSKNIILPVRPMIGVLGVAPESGDIDCAIPGDHGANMDAKVLAVGAKAYLPVAVEGAGLAVGDLHACMGDGELSGTGLEIAGRVCLMTTVIKRRITGRPVIETGEGIYAVASAPELDEAIRKASDDMVGILMRKKGLGFEEAYRLLSIACDIQICQVVNDLKTVRVRAPKSELEIDSPL